MQLLDGKSCSQQIRQEIAEQVDQIKSSGGRAPHLVAVLIGNDGASQNYVAMKTRDCDEVGFNSSVIHMNNATTEQKLLDTIAELNADSDIDGFIVQLPLPQHINESKVILAIDPKKDVDGFHPENAGLLAIGRPRFIPCTPKGIMRILEQYKIDLNGKHVVVVGRSNIVGRPLSILTSMKMDGANATTTICHSGTPNIQYHTKTADVIIVALGVPSFLDQEMIKKDAVVIDVGINRIDADNQKGYKLVGDADWQSIEKKASAATPVPGGVGPMTIAMLAENTVEAAENI